MARLSTPRWLLSAIMAVAVLCSFVAVYERARFLEGNRSVELSLDYAATVRLCHQVGYDPDSFIKRAKEAGITSLAIRGATVSELCSSGQAELLSAQELADRMRTGEAAWSIPFSPEFSYLVIYNQHLANATVSQLEGLYGPVTAFADEAATVIELAASIDELYDLSLGFSTESLTVARQYGLAPVFVIGPVLRTQPETVLKLLAQASDLGEGNKLIFAGWTVPGYPRYTDEIGDAVRRGGMMLAVFENRSQRGVDQLAAASDYSAFRARVVFPTDRSGSLALAARERQIRLFSVEPTLGTRVPEEAVDDWIGFIARAQAELAAVGMDLTGARGFPSYSVPTALLVAAAMGVGVASWLLATSLTNWRRYDQLGIFAAGAVGGFVLLGPVAREAVALLGALSFASLGIIAARALAARGQTGWAVLLAVLLAIAGGLIVVTLLGDTAWALKVRQFRGVKLFYVVPPLIILAAAWRERAQHCNLGPPEYLRRCLDGDIAVWHLLAVLAAAAAVVIYVGRSGHTLGIPVPAVEQFVRSLLEETLGTRPRTKEFLIGYPALVFTVMLARSRPWVAWGFAVAASVATTSVLNSFSHLHTPVWHSALRSAYGAGVGVVIGIVLHLAVTAVMTRRRRSP